MTRFQNLRYVYWALRRNRATAFHLLAVVPRFCASAVRLFHYVHLSWDRRPAVAIVMLHSMGDVVAAEPVAQLARKRFPNARLCWIVSTPYVSLPNCYRGIDHVVGVCCLTEWMLLRRIRLFDVIWDLHFNGYCCPRCCIPQDKPSTLLHEHNYFEYGSLLDGQCLNAGLPKLADGPAITPPPDTVAAVDALALPPRFIAIHCVSNDPRKDWPVDKWHELVACILTTYPTVTVVEVGLRPLVIRQDQHTGQRALCGTLSLLETAEVIRRAALYIGIDSGPAHLANAVGTPGVILLGAFRGFRSYMPYSGGYADGTVATIVRADGPAGDLAVEAVFAAVTARLATDDAETVAATRH
jgi:ADP-heptose:LPS heptosyltransferase